MKNLSAHVLAIVFFVVALAFTGWAAFVREDYVASADPEHIAELQKADPTGARAKAFEAGLEQLTESSRKRQDLAYQSFSLLLGAAIGYVAGLSKRNVGPT